MAPIYLFALLVLLLGGCIVDTTPGPDFGEPAQIGDDDDAAEAPGDNDAPPECCDPAALDGDCDGVCVTDNLSSVEDALAVLYSVSQEPSLGWPMLS